MFPFSGIVAESSSIACSPLCRAGAVYNHLVPRAIGETNLIAHIRKLPHGRATYKQLVKEFHATGDNRSQLDDALDRLAERGELVELRSGHFIATGENREYAIGKLSLHGDGFGFLVPERSIAGLSGDIFLPPGEAQKGMHGDRALAHISRMGHDGRAEGEIVRILRRAHATVVGEFRIKRRAISLFRRTSASSSGSKSPKGMEIPAIRRRSIALALRCREIKTVKTWTG